MLFIPLEGKISWKNPPVITILLILVNCFVFFVCQSGESRKAVTAATYYFDSGLARIELPRYAAHLEKKTGQSVKTGPLDTPSAEGVALLMRMQRDSDFMNALYNGSIISPETPAYDGWKIRRTAFDNKMDRIVSHHFGLIPARPKPLTFFTAMFLHGSFSHLLGNMIFLWIVGCVLEMGIGRIIYAIGYIVVGLLANLFYYIVHLGSHIPIIGASGAISGLLGALAVLYGFTRIRVFFTTGFYFDVFKLPAILLLPFWVGKELFQFYAAGAAPVAYMAHAGGLMSGGVLGLGGKRFLVRSKPDFFAEKKADPVPEMLESALSCISRLDFDGARQHLAKVLKIQPDNPAALTHLFNIEKNRPERPEFHESAQRLLTALVDSRTGGDQAIEVFTEYRRLAAPPKLSTGTYLKLSRHFVGNGHMDDAEKIIRSIMKKRPDYPLLPTAILHLIRGFDTRQMPDRGQRYRELLLAKYPDSHEAKILGAQAVK